MRLRPSWNVIIPFLALFLPLFSGFAQLPAIIDFGQIATRADGLHAMPISRNGHCSLWLWATNADKGSEVVLTNQAFHWPSIQFTANGVAVVDMGGDYAAGRASTWTLDGQKLDEQVFGNQWMRWGGSCVMPSGGVVFVNYSQETASIVLDINYRRPAMPPAPGTLALPSAWWTQRIIREPCNGQIPSANVSVAELNGIIHVFVTRDSAGCLMLLRLKEDGTGGLVQVDWQPNYIVDVFNNGVQDPMAPHGEFPDLAVRKDPYHNRILAMYQGDYGHVWCEVPYCFPIIIAVYPDLHRELLVRTTNYSERTMYLTCWARPDGPYGIQENTPHCGDWGFISFGPSGVIRSEPVHFNLESSPDGWFATWGTNNDPHLYRAPFRPALSAFKTSALTRAQVMALAAQAQKEPLAQSFVAPQNVAIASDEGDPAMLESTVDLKKWKAYSFVTNWPVLIPQTNQQQFFRTRQP